MKSRMEDLSEEEVKLIRVLRNEQPAAIVRMLQDRFGISYDRDLIF